MKVLFADQFPDAYRAEITSLGHQCDYQPDLNAADLPTRIDDAEVLVVRSTQVDATTISAASALKLVIRAGAGTNTIDKVCAREKGVDVCNVPGKNAVAVAELTMGLILALDRQIPDNVRDLRAGRWDKKKYSVANGIYGARIGIVGTGAIGLAVAKRAHAFGMQVLVVEKPHRDEETVAALSALDARVLPDLDTLVSECDILTLHVPASPATKGMVNSSLLSRLRDGAMLINTSRGDVVDEAALLASIEKKSLKVAVDVYADEPSTGQGDFDSALAKHENVYGTHHIGASTTQAQNAVAEGVVEILRAFANGEVRHRVN